jgi:hypothetical protein
MLIIAAKHGVLRRIPLLSVHVRQEKRKGEPMSGSTRSGPEAFRLALRPAVAVVLVALAGAGPAAAQITRGAISGTIRDATGAVVPGASVTVTNMDTNIGRSAVTNTVGFYRVPALDPGRYAVLTELVGFSRVESRDIAVRTATEVTLNVELKVGGRGEAITVMAKPEAIELNKTNPTIGLTSTARQAVELPLNADRNINNLVLLT